MSGPDRIERTAFSTDRLLDFVSEKELTLQCGYGPIDWPLVAVKELIDNALDACEEQELAPEITVTIDRGAITVADNGNGIPPGTVDRLLDFSIRVSSREAYVAPDRGAQGNALKVIVAMPFVIDGAIGRVDIVGRGVQSEIAFCVDRIQQRPSVAVTRSCKAGSLVRVHLRPEASYEDDNSVSFLQNGCRLEDVAPRIRTLADDFTFLNPHLTLTLDCFGERTTVEATDPHWRKWIPASPTSPHWYELEHLERLIGAYITHDRQNGNHRRRLVREFISEFKGLTSTIKQKAVLSELGLAREPLESLVLERDFDHERIAQLLNACQPETKPVAPKQLVPIGRAHQAARFKQLGLVTAVRVSEEWCLRGDARLPQ